MNLSQAKLGDQYRVFVDSVGNISTLPSMNTLLATVIAIKKTSGNGYILGWKKGEPHPPNANTRGNTSHLNEYVSNQAEYLHGVSVKQDLPVAIQIFNGVDGFPCKKCGNFYPQALPNQKDGTLVCWSCRNGH